MSKELYTEDMLANLYAPPARGFLPTNRVRGAGYTVGMEKFLSRKGMVTSELIPEEEDPCAVCGGLGEVWGRDDMGKENLYPCAACKGESCR